MTFCSTHPILFLHSGFCIISFNVLSFIEILEMLCRYILFYAVYGFLKLKMILDNRFMANSCFIFESSKFGGRIYTKFPVFLEWIIWVNEGLLLRLHLTQSVKKGFPLLLLPSSSRHIRTDIKRIECQMIFPANICLFKVKNRKTRRRCEKVQSWQWRHQNNLNDVFLVSLLLTLNICQAFF